MTKRKHFSPEALDASLLPKQRKPIPHAFVLDAISTLSPYTRPMFGCLAIYVKDKIVLILRDKPKSTEDNGVWLATTQEHHQSLRREFPNMRSIQVLGKRVTGWQVLPVDAADFESAALRACELVLAGDPRIGKIPGARTSKSGSKATGRSSKQIKTSKKHGSTINFDSVRKIGLALPGVEESTAYGAPALKIRGKLMACMPTHRSTEPNSLEGAVTTDICGKKESHAVRLDKEAVDSIKKARLHQKVATSIFFESNGGQSKTEATLPEIRLAVAEPDIDIGNIETVLETLATTCYFLSSEKSRYRFSLSPNLNKLLADRRASVQPKKIEDTLRAEVQRVFTKGTGVERVYFPEKSGQITDRPVLSLVVMPPEQSISEKATRAFIESATKESGTSGRTYKSGLVWAVPDSPDSLRDEARKVLAWADIEDEADDLRLDDAQKKQLSANKAKADRDLSEAVWRTYKNLMLLAKDNSWKIVDLGLVHSSAATSIVELILNRLRQDGDIEDAVSPSFLDRNWPPAFKEWSTKSVRDAFFASPQFPRLLNSESLKDTIARGVETGMLGYVGKKPDGSYVPFQWKSSLTAFDVELSEDMYIIQRATAEAYLAGRSASAPTLVLHPPETPVEGTPESPKPGSTVVPVPPAGINRVTWQGDVPPQKWMNFYTKVLSKFATQSGLKIGLNVEIAPDGGVSNQKVDEIKVALRELGLPDDVSVG